MKRGQREVYRELADEICSPICSFCKYSECSGPCEDVDMECKHPLEKVRDWVADDAMQLGDCWAYRPHYKLSDIADIVGIIIAHQWDFATWREEGGILKVYGRVAEGLEVGR